MTPVAYFVVKNVDVCAVSELVLPYVSKWLTASKLVLNLDHMNVIKFITNDLPYCALRLQIQNFFVYKLMSI
jgi:hypothetical protein